jgi:hypothetical protein
MASPLKIKPGFCPAACPKRAENKQEEYTMNKKTLKRGLIAAFVVCITLGILSGCPTDADDNTSQQNTNKGFNEETILSETPLPAFDINNPPAPDYWNNTVGEKFNLPNPFVFANGSPVTDASQWPQRRAELSKILQYYLYGTLPPAPSSSTYALYAGNSGTDAWVKGTTTSGRLVITMTNGSNGPVTLTSTITLPSGGTGPYPAYNMDLAGSGWATYTIPGQGSDAYWTETIGILYGYGATTEQWRASLDAPSALMCNAWGMDRLIDGLEWVRDQFVEANSTEYIDPTKIMVTGTSRGGKQALVIGAFSERVAITFPNSSGALGATVERFLTPSAGGANKIDYYFKFVGDGAPFDNKNNYNSGGSQQNPWGFKAVAPGEDYDKLYIFGKDAKGPGIDQGYQTQPHAWSDSGGTWPSERNKLFTELHKEWNIDKEWQHGYMGTMPYDQHFLTALCAPRGLLVTDGAEAYWCNPEGTGLGYLATREVYKFLGAENKLGLKIYVVEHSGTSLKPKDVLDFAGAYFANQDPDTYSDPDREGPTSFRFYPYALNDSRSKLDYLRLYWKAPGSTDQTIREQVQELLP